MIQEYRADPFFHNANSIIKSEWLKPDLFNEDLSNIEDREWAAKIITKGKIFYSARSSISLPWTKSF